MKFKHLIKYSSFNMHLFSIILVDKGACRYASPQVDNAAVTNLFQRHLQHFILVIICVVCPVRWYTSYMSLKCLLCFSVMILC